MIKKPGFYEMSDAQYHADPCPTPSLSATIAKIMVTRSPAHAYWEHPRLNPSFQREESEAFDIGTIAHDALLQGANRIEVIDADSWRTNAAKEARAAARAKGLIPLLAKNYDRVSLMVKIANDAIADCPDLSGLTLRDGKAEQVIVWQDIGTWCRSKLDWLAHDRAVILDYKTCSGSAEPNDAMRTHIIPHGFDVQAAFYLRGLRCIVPTATATKFVFLIQETDAPYCCSFVGMPPAFIEFGEHKVSAAIRTWAACLRDNTWPAYPNRIFWPDVPPWAEARYLEREMAQGYPVDFEKLFGAKAP